MTLDRRRALGALGLAALSARDAAAQTAKTGRAPAGARFAHGVASGDPLVDRVVLWTRVTVPGDVAVQVHWELAADPTFSAVVARGVQTASSHRDHTVKIDVAGLNPGRDYVYRFSVGQTRSPIGRTRTLPKGATDKAVLAFVTCSLYPNGLFNAYDHIARLERVDAVVHLGDYIYEYGAADGDYGMANGRRLGRIPEPPHEIVTLADYRTRHALYKRDPDLQAAHARAPWICVWDDHEVANDSWVGGAENHQPKTEGPWATRQVAALQAYYEWMPIREPAPGWAFEAINRSFSIGDLATLIMVESRLVARSAQMEYDRPGDVPLTVYDGADPLRSRPLADKARVAALLAAATRGEAPPAPLTIGPDVAALKALVANPERQMMGVRQEQWLASQIAVSAGSGQPWQVLGNQVVMARVRGPDVRRSLGPEAFAKLLASLPPEQATGLKRLADLFAYDVPYDLDGWDGYEAARERVYDALKSAMGNVVVLSGDSHGFWANELHDASGLRVAAEFGVGPVSSPNPDDDLPGISLGPIFAAQNPEVTFSDQGKKGYVLLTLTHQDAVAEMVTIDTLKKPYAAATLARFRVRPAEGPAPGPIQRA